MGGREVIGGVRPRWTAKPLLWATSGRLAALGGAKMGGGRSATAALQERIALVKKKRSAFRKGFCGLRTKSHKGAMVAKWHLAFWQLSRGTILLRDQLRSNGHLRLKGQTPLGIRF